MNRKTPLRSKTGFKRTYLPKAQKDDVQPILKRKKLKQIGKRGREWVNARNELKEEFSARGITRCESGISTDCWNECTLGFAHAVPRRYLKKDAPLGDPYHIKTVALLCVNCHHAADSRGHEYMQETVMNIILRRES